MLLRRFEIPQISPCRAPKLSQRCHFGKLEMQCQRWRHSAPMSLQLWYQPVTPWKTVNRVFFKPILFKLAIFHDMIMNQNGLEHVQSSFNCIRVELQLNDGRNSACYLLRSFSSLDPIWLNAFFSVQKSKRTIRSCQHLREHLQGAPPPVRPVTSLGVERNAPPRFVGIKRFTIAEGCSSRFARWNPFVIKQFLQYSNRSRLYLLKDLLGSGLAKIIPYWAKNLSTSSRFCSIRNT